MTAPLVLSTPADTEAAGARLASSLSGGMVVTLSGELGAGKTTFARGCLRALGWKGPVKSPTYAIVEHYLLSSLYFYHIDFYRFADPREWETAGVAECFREDAVCMIEWPERVAGYLPRPDLELALSYSSAPDTPGRLLTPIAYSEQGRQCADAIMSIDRARTAR